MEVSMGDSREKRDLVLAPGTFAYMQDVTTGLVKTFVGPCVINQTAQEVPVVYDARLGVFRRCEGLEEAVRKAPIAVEGYYLVLKNPVSRGGDEHPESGSSGKGAPRLEVGRKINIPGPCMFALWPGQDALVVRGHHLRSNQYLLVRVYNEDEARANWAKAVVKPAALDPSGSGAGGPGADRPPDLTAGRQLIIKGTEVSFYIPPTGVGVVAEGRDEDSRLRYVRDALTLERLEYCILVDEDGNKRYERGPQVVFPEPTETFVVSEGQRKFRAVELNEIQGLHVKVISPYADDEGTEHREGDELFITGRETAIYFPREEHSLVRYDGQTKHFATAIPAGEGRYVMDRVTGEIETIEGPAMLLPDPRRKVIARRILTDQEVKLWYPGDSEALEYHRHLRGLLSRVPTTRSGVISEGDFERGSRSSRKARKFLALKQGVVDGMEQSVLGDQEPMADEFTRAADFSSPRSITLDGKYQGVPTIDVWPGRAVMVVSKTGARRVVRGPARVLLRYDEGLAVLKRSSTAGGDGGRAVETVFLWTVDNKVFDVMEVETRDGVRVRLGQTYTIEFEGDPERWFAVESYAQLLCDRVHSVVAGAIGALGVEGFFERSRDVVKDAVLGPAGEAGRPGMALGENGMRVVDVAVTAVTVLDDRIAALLEQAGHDAVRSGIELSAAGRELEKTRALERIGQEMAEAKRRTELALLALQDEVRRAEQEVNLAALARRRDLEAADRARRLAEIEGAQAAGAREIEIEGARHQASLGRRRDEQELALLQLAAQTRAVVDQAQAISPHVAAALERLADEKLLTALAGGFGELAAARGVGLLESAKQFFDFLPEGKLHVLRHVGPVEPAKPSR
jgi:major vault protein